jgi:hypothetical protein
MTVNDVDEVTIESGFVEVVSDAPVTINIGNTQVVTNGGEVEAGFDASDEPTVVNNSTSPITVSDTATNSSTTVGAGEGTTIDPTTGQTSVQPATQITRPTITRPTITTPDPVVTEDGAPDDEDLVTDPDVGGGTPVS